MCGIIEWIFVSVTNIIIFREMGAGVDSCAGKPIGTGIVHLLEFDYIRMIIDSKR